MPWVRCECHVAIFNLSDWVWSKIRFLFLLLVSFSFFDPALREASNQIFLGQFVSLRWSLPKVLCLYVGLAGRIPIVDFGAHISIVLG